MTYSPDNFDDDRYVLELMAPIDEITIGPFLYCGRRDGKTTFLFSDDCRYSISLINHILPTMMRTGFPIHSLEERAVPYVQSFFRKMKIVNACFIMQGSDRIYHAVNGNRKEVAYGLIDSLDFIYSGDFK